MKIPNHFLSNLAIKIKKKIKNSIKMPLKTLLNH
jgi:hypothetical protein